MLSSAMSLCYTRARFVAANRGLSAMSGSWLAGLIGRPKRSISNVGKWRRNYRDLDRVKLYGDSTTYELAAEFLADMDEVEDWGCGSGGFRKFCKTAYIGVDGTQNQFVDTVADLASYRSGADAILLRHVLEHNPEWAKVLDNALGSFRRKLCIVLFTPFAEETKEIKYYRKMDVVDISFRKQDLISRFGANDWRLEQDLKTESLYGVEHVFYIQK